MERRRSSRADLRPSSHGTDAPGPATATARSSGLPSGGDAEEEKQRFPPPAPAHRTAKAGATTANGASASRGGGRSGAAVTVGTVDAARVGGSPVQYSARSPSHHTFELEGPRAPGGTMAGGGGNLAPWDGRKEHDDDVWLARALLITGFVVFPVWYASWVLLCVRPRHGQAWCLYAASAIMAALATAGLPAVYFTLHAFVVTGHIVPLS